MRPGRVTVSGGAGRGAIMAEGRAAAALTAGPGSPRGRRFASRPSTTAAPVQARVCEKGGCVKRALRRSLVEKIYVIHTAVIVYT